MKSPIDITPAVRRALRRHSLPERITAINRVPARPADVAAALYAISSTPTHTERGNRDQLAALEFILLAIAGPPRQHPQIQI